MSPRDSKEVPTHAVVVNTTSRSKDFGKAFSPFMNQGPIKLGNLTAHNVENMWQFTKVYKEHVNDFAAWKKWRDDGLKDTFAHRYPMGKGRKPEFSFFMKKKMDYITARKNLYIPAYKQKLEKYCQRQINTLIDMLTVCDVWLWDFDVRITEESFEEIVNNSEHNLGHAFIIKKYVYDKLGREL
jgi:hypothetical protein